MISHGGSFDGLSQLDELVPSVKTDLNSDRGISPSSVGKYVNVAGWVGGGGKMARRSILEMGRAKNVGN